MINRYIYVLVFLSIFVSFHSLSGLVDGRISGNKIPSLTSEITLEKSEFLYNAPVYRYINLNFGFMVNRFQNPGLTFGLDFQWLDGETVSGTIRTNGVFLTNRKLSEIILGGYFDASFLAGVKISGFKGVAHSIITATPGNDPLIALEVQLGAYVSPHESLNIFVAPGIGKYFVKSEQIYLNLILSLEVFLWK